MLYLVALNSAILRENDSHIHGMSDQSENIPVGIGLMLLTMFFFVSLDAIAKYLMQFYPAPQVIWGRFFFHVVCTLVLIFFIRVSWREAVVSHKPSIQISRSLLMLATNGLFFLAIKTIDLTTATAIMFLSPIVLTVLAIPVLGEKVGLRRWSGVVLGFIGAMIIVRPGLIDLNTAILLLCIATVTHAFYQIFTRQIRIYDHPITSLFYTGIIGSIIMSSVLPMYWVAPIIEHWPLFALLGITGCAGHFCLIRALRAAPVSVVSPFSYSTLIWATGFSYLLFDELPDIWVYIGAAIIVISGLYILYREQQLEKKDS